jgi:hypothetical protein
MKSILKFFLISLFRKQECDSNTVEENIEEKDSDCKARGAAGAAPPLHLSRLGFIDDLPFRRI